jgi:hypothetical protein
MRRTGLSDKEKQHLINCNACTPDAYVQLIVLKAPTKNKPQSIKVFGESQLPRVLQNKALNY